MSDVRDIYQEVILDHGRNPRNRRAIGGTDHHADGNNPLCGDRVTVYATVEDGVLKDISFEGDGCAISVASASVMTEALRGKRLEEAESLFGAFHEMLTAESEDGLRLEGIGKLAVFRGVRDFPVRVKCATLAWHTLRAALSPEREAVTTE